MDKEQFPQEERNFQLTEPGTDIFEAETREEIGKPSRDEEAPEDLRKERDMAHLGAGTGVDIGPGAAGEMGGSARERVTEDQVQTGDIEDLPE